MKRLKNTRLRVAAETIRGLSAADLSNVDAGAAGVTHSPLVCITVTGHLCETVEECP